MSRAALKDRLSDQVENLEAESEGKVISIARADITIVDSEYAALANNALDIITANLKNQPLSYHLFDVVKSPSGGATVFIVPGLNGDEPERELTGIILDYTTPRAYWESSDPIEGELPVCYSSDSLVSRDGKSCSHCQFNDFGSRDGDSNAKACKESVQILLLRPNNIMPILVRVPVSSKLTFQRYMTRLVGRMITLSGVITRITLEKATSKQGKPYALYSFEAVSSLSQEEASAARVFGQRIVDIVNADNIEPAVTEVT